MNNDTTSSCVMAMAANASPHTRKMTGLILDTLFDYKEKHDEADNAHCGQACFYVLCALVALIDDDALREKIISRLNEMISEVVAANRRELPIDFEVIDDADATRQ